MKILDNELIVLYNPDQEKIEIYRSIEGSKERYFLTECPLSKLKSMGFNEGGRLLGENILLFLEGTRDEFDQ